ncbi:hypothetical protein ACFLVI_03700 [Chloroflexota bacterium]
MVFRRMLSLVTFIIVLAVVLTACGGGSEATPTTASESTPSATNYTPTSTDPASSATPTPAQSTATPTSTAVPAPGSTPTPSPSPSQVGDFFLDIVSPSELEVIVDTDAIIISGRTTIDAVVTVNDAFPELDLDGMFQISVQLVEGVNIIEIVASIATGEQLDRVLTVIYAS